MSKKGVASQSRTEGLREELLAERDLHDLLDVEDACTDGHSFAHEEAGGPSQRQCYAHKHDHERWSQGWSWAFVSLSALAIGICYADRANIADAIIPMAKDLGWSRSEEGAILSSFFLGYGATQIVGGSLADKFGGKRVLAVAVLMWSIATLLSPTFAKLGVAPLIGMRIVLGVGEGPAFPAVHSMISRAVLPQHQSTAVAAVTSASYVGSVAAFIICPLLFETTFFEKSWEAVFYFFGGLGLLFLPLWTLLPIHYVSQPLERRHVSSEVVEPAHGVCVCGSGGDGDAATCYAGARGGGVSQPLECHHVSTEVVQPAQHCSGVYTSSLRPHTLAASEGVGEAHSSGGSGGDAGAVEKEIVPLERRRVSSEGVEVAAHSSAGSGGDGDAGAAEKENVWRQVHADECWRMLAYAGVC